MRRSASSSTSLSLSPSSSLSSTAAAGRAAAWRAAAVACTARTRGGSGQQPEVRVAQQQGEHGGELEAAAHRAPGEAEERTAPGEPHARGEGGLQVERDMHLNIGPVMLTPQGGRLLLLAVMCLTWALRGWRGEREPACAGYKSTASDKSILVGRQEQGQRQQQQQRTAAWVSTQASGRRLFTWKRER